jgi:LPXTG-motif cell wall-anchored protein
MPAFMQEWWFFAIMILVLLGLIGALLYLRNKRPED